MVDQIGAKPVGGGVGVSPVTRAPATTAPAVVDQPAAKAPATLARTMAASAPVDTDRVAQIKQAIAEGTYPILPETVADRLLALKLEWKPK